MEHKAEGKDQGSLKKTYSSPIIREYGEISEVTQGIGASGVDVLGQAKLLVD